jgi:hypothetical protein
MTKRITCLLISLLTVLIVMTVSIGNAWEVFEPQEQIASWHDDCLGQININAVCNGGTGTPQIWEPAQVGCGAFYGAAFDGKYVYSYSTVRRYLVRYNTTKPFNDINDTSGWEKYSLDNVVTGGGFHSIFYLNNKIYLSPEGGWSTWVMYDTTKPFNESTSYSTYNFASAGNGGIRGICSDGEYLYGTPFSGNNVVRVDTCDFTNSNSWSKADLSVFEVPGTPGYLGCTFSGNSLVITPYTTGSNIFIQYDKSVKNGVGKFTATDSNAWSYHDAHDINNAANPGTQFTGVEGYHGGCEAGFYLYYAPFGLTAYDSGADNFTHGKFLRRDKRKSFDDQSAWEAFDLEDTSLGHGDWEGFWDCTYDGKNRIYLIPHASDSSQTWNAELVSYDITQPFNFVSSYKSIMIGDLSASCSSETRYSNGVYANGYVYIFGLGIQNSNVNGANGRVVRVSDADFNTP